MFALSIRYLNGWAMAASDGARKERAEWPPHPDRIFMAIAAAWFETGEADEEKNALEWLETLPPPGIVASDALFRHDFLGGIPVTSYVPVNDSVISRKIPETNQLKKLKEAGLSLVPDYRPRQPRKFPVAIPHIPIVHMIWNESMPPEHKEPFISLCQKVASIGHSASLVQMWLTENPPEPNWIPVTGLAVHRLRVFGPGRLEYLKRRCNHDEVIRYRDLTATLIGLEGEKKEIDLKRKKAIKGRKGGDKKMAEEPFLRDLEATELAIESCRAELETFNGRIPASLRPEPGLWQGYGHSRQEIQNVNPGSIFDERLVIMNISGKRLHLASTLKLTEAIRGALLSACSEPIPEWISGHQPDGTRSLDPHIACFPLPFVGRDHSDGRIMGVALALPKRIDKKEAARILAPWLREENGLPRRVRLFDGQWLECMAELETRETPPWSLQSEQWMKPSRIWASVTPIVLDRHFDGKDKWDRASEVVQDACERIGLPRPERVLLHPVSLVEGAPHSREFPPIKRKSDNGRMHHCHGVIFFQEPVTGPVLLGAGRFRGYGLCRPMDQGGADNE